MHRTQSYDLLHRVPSEAQREARILGLLSTLLQLAVTMTACSFPLLTCSVTASMLSSHLCMRCATSGASSSGRTPCSLRLRRSRASSQLYAASWAASATSAASPAAATSAVLAAAAASPQPSSAAPPVLPPSLSPPRPDASPAALLPSDCGCSSSCCLTAGCRCCCSVAPDAVLPGLLLALALLNALAARSGTSSLTASPLLPRRSAPAHEEETVSC